MPSKHQLVSLAIAIVFGSALLLFLGQNTSTISVMSITHLVLFQFKADAAAEVIKDVCDRMLALKDTCIHPTLQRPYIISASGGADNSPEGIQKGITHAFVVEFATAEDRNYYVKEDPVHQAFIGSLSGVIETAQVIDFTPGVF